MKLTQITPFGKNSDCFSLLSPLKCYIPWSLVHPLTTASLPRLNGLVWFGLVWFGLFGFESGVLRTTNVFNKKSKSRMQINNDIMYYLNNKYYYYLYINFG